MNTSPIDEGRRIAAYLKAEGSPAFVRHAEGIEQFLFGVLAGNHKMTLCQCVGWRPKQGEAPWWTEATRQNLYALYREYDRRFVTGNTRTRARARQIASDLNRAMTTRNNGTPSDPKRKLLGKILAHGANIPMSWRQIIRIIDERAVS